MAGRLLPDTNAFIAHAGGNLRVQTALDQADAVMLAAAVLGELKYGALNSGSPARNLARVAEITAPCTFAPVDGLVVDRYAEIRSALKRMGRPIPENDLWIAATALAIDAVVMTDDAHFAQIAGLRTIPIP